MQEGKIAQNIRSIIDNKDMTISEFAEYVDLPVETIRSILYGKCKDLRLSTLIAISSRCGMSMDYIVYGIGGMAA